MSDVAERLTLDVPIVEDVGSGPVPPDTGRPDSGRARTLRPGTRVEVKMTFDQTYARGFEVIDRTDEGYRLRRLSDGTELPAVFADTDVRKERRAADMWWY
jgi:hypothetical protein